MYVVKNSLYTFQLRKKNIIICKTLFLHRFSGWFCSLPINPYFKVVQVYNIHYAPQTLQRNQNHLNI